MTIENIDQCDECGSYGCECSCPSPESLQEMAAALRAAAERVARACAPTTPDPEQGYKAAWIHLRQLADTWAFDGMGLDGAMDELADHHGLDETKP